MNPFENNDEDNSTNPFEESNNFINDENPFDTDTNTTDTKESIANNTFSKIEMNIITNGRKSNTYITNWNISKDELNTHLKIIKNKLGCNGSVKEKKKVDSDGNIISITIEMQLQGNHKKSMIEYFTKLGINESLLCIKG